MSAPWSEGAHTAFKAHGVRQVGYVPDGGLKTLIGLCEADNDIRTVPATTEEEAVAIAAGAWLGGQKAAVLMQSSGVGNTINMFASLIVTCRFPLFAIVTMRGDFGETNPWQLPMGQSVAPVLESLGVRVFKATSDADAVETINAGLAMAFSADEPVAVLIGQRLIGAKAFTSAIAGEPEDV